MKEKEKIETDHEKKIWIIPSIQVIPFKNTKGGVHEMDYEGGSYINPTS